MNRERVPSSPRNARKPGRTDTTTKIKWKCGHQWFARNTPTYPDSGDATVKFGCPYCGCKEVKEREELYYGKTKFRGK